MSFGVGDTPGRDGGLISAVLLLSLGQARALCIHPLHALECAWCLTVGRPRPCCTQLYILLDLGSRPSGTDSFQQTREAEVAEYLERDAPWPLDSAR